MAKVAKTGLRELLAEVAKNFRHADLLADAGIEIGEKRDPSDYMSEARKAKRIDFALADVVLRRSILAGDPVQRALSHLAETGIPAEELGGLETVIRRMVPNPQTSTEVIIDRDVIAPKTLTAISGSKNEPRLPARAREPEEAYNLKGLQPIPAREPLNLRHELKVFHPAKPNHPKAVKVPQWLHLAAGDGCDLELCEDYKYFRELPDWKGIHSALIRGDSMLQTLEPGDVIVMQELNGRGYTLPQIEADDDKFTLDAFQRESGLKDRDIVVVSINREPPTLKRLRIATWHGRKDWKLQIVADNEDAWGPPYQVALGDEIVFHAKLRGIESREKDRSRYKVQS